MARYGMARALVVLLLGIAGAACGGDEGLRTLGESCNMDEECASRRCDELVCKGATPSAEGEPCSHPLECLSEVCLSALETSICGPGIRDIGSGCTADAQCASGRCVERQCVEAVDAGSPDRALGDSAPPDQQIADAPGGEAAPDLLSVDAGLDAPSPDLTTDLTADAAIPDTRADAGTPEQGADSSADIGAADLAGTDARSLIHAWSHTPPGATGSDYANEVAVDALGNVAVVGHFSGSVDFGGGPLNSAGGQDIFVVSFDSAGQHRWSKRYGGALDDQANAVAIDATNHVVVVGEFRDTADLEGGPHTSTGEQDFFVSRFDVDGQHVFTNVYGSALADVATDVALDGAGGIHLTGTFSDTMRFGKGSPVASQGEGDVFVMQLATDGTAGWANTYGGTVGDGGSTLAVDNNGFVVVGGYFSDTVTFGTTPLVAAGDSDIFLLRLDSAGGQDWVKRFGNVNIDVVSAVAVDGSGNIALTGWIWSPGVSFGGQLLPVVGLWDTFLVLFDSAGQHQWSRVFGGDYADVSEDVAFDSVGNIYLAGYYSGTMDFGFGPLPGSGGYDFYFAKFDGTGTAEWAARVGWTGSERAYGLALTPDDGLVLCGSFDETGSFGDGLVTSANGRDLFVVKYLVR